MNTVRDKCGRKKDSIRRFFEEITKNDKIVGMRCKECSSIISAKACRMRNHFQKCPNRQKCEQDSDESTSVSEVSSVRSHSPTSSSSYYQTESIKKQPSITSFLVKTNKTDKLKLDKAVARYFYSCNVPFNHASRLYFKKMIEELRPGYSAPTRKDLSTTLLDNICDDVREEAIRELQGKSVTLIQDGWSSIHNDPVIANCVTNGTNIFFLSAVDTETNHKTTEYCLKLAEEAIHDCELEYGCTVKSFVSDNESKMVKLRKELVKKYSVGDGSFFIAYGCAAHYLNLLGGDICKTKNISLIMREIIEVSKYFKSHQVAKGFLNSYGGVMPQLPNETRWNSHIRCLETYMQNKDVFLKIIDEHEEEVDTNIRNIINNIALYKEVKHLISLLKPISISLDVLQRDSSTIADVTNEFLTLLKSEELRIHNKYLQKRFDDCITPAHILSYMLHPKFMGEGLTNDQEEIARKWVNDIDKNFLPLIVKFSIKTSPFPATYFSDAMINVGITEKI